MLELAAAQALPFFSSHFAESSVGRVTKAEDGFHWQFS